MQLRFAVYKLKINLTFFYENFKTILMIVYVWEIMIFGL